MISVFVGHDVMNPKSWSLYEDQDNFVDFLLKEFAQLYPQFPPTARFYHESVDQEHDITPILPLSSDAEDSLRNLTGTIYVLIYPATGEPISTNILVNVGVTIGLQLLKAGINALIPDKKDRTHQIRQGSSNNTLGERLNKARLGERVPDIYGRVSSTPDLVQVPYIVYDNHRQVETSLMCVGVGEYEVFRVREGESDVEEINGMSVRVYPPGEAPGGGTPQFPEIGPDITDPAFVVVPIQAVKGDVLLPFNSRTLIGRIRRTEKQNLKLNSIGYQYVGSGVGRLIIEWDISPEEITDKINVGDELHVDWQPLNAAFYASIDAENVVAGTGSPPNLDSGTITLGDGELLTVTAINDTYLGFNSVEILVDIPLSQQAQWAAIATYSPASEVMYNFIASVTPVTGYWHGPFFCDDPGPFPFGQQIYCNFVAERGLFVDDGKNQAPRDQVIEVVLAPADEDGNIDGAFEVHTTTVVGSFVQRTTRAKTFVITPSFNGRFLIWVRNATFTPWRQNGELPRLGQSDDTTFQHGPYGTDYKPRTGLIQDEIRWTHCYSMSRPANISFGDVTLVHTRTVARKDSQVQLNERRFNMIVTRRIPEWTGVAIGSVTTTTFAVDAFFDILTRPSLGNIPDEMIDFFGIAAAFQAVGDHFVDFFAQTFSGTFDEDNISLEEMLEAVASCCFCVAYRDGSIVKLKADIDTPNSVLLFNHRNKLPDSEQRSVTFGTDEDYDGVEVQYYDESDDRFKTYFVPREGTAQKYRKVSVMGLYTEKQAAWHAWRTFYRLLFQNTTVEFEACDEAGLAVVRDRILVADNTRSETQDGEVLAVDGTTITTSQPVDDPDPPYTVFLQHTDGTVQSIDATIQDSRHVVLGEAPSLPLVVDGTANLRTGYILVANSEPAPTAFTVVEKAFKDLGVYSLTAVNYSAMYYAHEGLYFWAQFNVNIDRPTLDSSPYEVATTINGGSNVNDVTRGQVWQGTTHNDWVDFGNTFSPFGYTKALWVNKTNSGVERAGLICVPESSEEQFSIDDDASNTLFAMHSSTPYVTYPNFPIGVWVHAAVTWNADTEEMFLYVNGELVDSATSVPAPVGVFATRRAFGCVDGVDGLIGRADDCRLYHRVLSHESIRHLYQRTFK